jgi:glucose-1-phosphate cytidylyltransferase
VKVAILCGGLGTRLSEETDLRPKPMVEIGGQPILWHIMRNYASYGYKEFVLALGYKGELIKRYFLDYFHLQRNLSVSLNAGLVTAHDDADGGDDWLVHMIDTGQFTETGGRIKRLAQWLGGEPFMLTYGDGVGNVNLAELERFHRLHGRLATVTAVHPPSRFGGLTFNNEFVKEFSEKPQIGEGWINGGFFVLDPQVLDYIDGDGSFFEREPLEQLARDEQLVAYKHDGFWQCMDTLRDVRALESLWTSGQAPWAVWKTKE